MLILRVLFHMRWRIANFFKNQPNTLDWARNVLFRNARDNLYTNLRFANIFTAVWTFEKNILDTVVHYADITD